jgi:hypothetical protein
MKIAFSGLNLILLRITYTNWPTVKSDGTRYFFLSIVAISDLSTFSQMTGIRSGYFVRIRSASAFRFSTNHLWLSVLSFLAPVGGKRRRRNESYASQFQRNLPKGCSSLNLDLIC